MRCGGSCQYDVVGCAWGKPFGVSPPPMLEGCQVLLMFNLEADYMFRSKKSTLQLAELTLVSEILSEFVASYR